MKSKEKKEQVQTEGNKERKEKKQKVVRSESIVTKESFCAVVALLSILSFLILLTKDSVFGEPGAYIHALLIGSFGYLAYPVILLFGYACVMGF